MKIKAAYLKNGQPVISMDTKKKEMIGNFYHAGKLYTRETIEVLDHDFPSYSEGRIVPHGLYDIGLNKAHVNLGTSRDTTVELHNRSALPQPISGNYFLNVP